MHVAMVGAGPRAEAQLHALRASGAGVPVAVWDRNPERAAHVAERWGIRSVFGDIGEMVASTRPDLVSVVTHPSFRLEPMRAAVDAGARALLVEKPLALTRAELDAIDGLDAFIAVNTQYPWMAHWVRFRERIARGELGGITSITASTAVGVLDQGPHALSLVLSALPGTPALQRIERSGEAEYAGLPVPANVRAEYTLRDARLTLIAGDTAPLVPGEGVIWYQQQVEIVGTRGRLWSSLNQGWTWSSDAGVERGTTSWPRDDEQSQSALFVELAAAVGDPVLQAGFATRLGVASGQARLILDAAGR